MPSQAVQLDVQDHEVIMDNGILRLTISKPGGFLTGVSYNGVNNLLQAHNAADDRGYWDLVWSEEGTTGTTGHSYRIKGQRFHVVVENEEQAEISFSRDWDPSVDQGNLAPPLNIDKRFVLLRGCSGFYTYGIYEHMKEWPAFNMPQTRIVFKLRKDKFEYMAIADNRQRHMPLPEDRTGRRGRALATPEAVLLVHPVEPEFQGEVDDKYEYSCENKDLQVHGWICQNKKPFMGFWQITPSYEFRSGGPLKQNLSSHCGPITLAMFLSAHYAGEDMVMKVKAGEPWKKVFGPVFIYLNSLDGEDDDPISLWRDAKHQTQIEIQNWPYNFPASNDFPKSNERGSVNGKLYVRDSYIAEDNIEADGAFVGLAPLGEVGSWQTESKVELGLQTLVIGPVSSHDKPATWGYQFWTKAATDGSFTITNIRTGEYYIYAFVPGFIGDYRYISALNMTPGSKIDVGNIVYEPPRHGPTLWEIGKPDRSAAEFYVPDPNPNYINKLYVNHPDKFRQYGLWERYAELYPESDLIYTVGVSDSAKDWFFAHVTRKNEQGKFQATTWQVKFKLDFVEHSKIYKLRVAIATANVAELQVRFNDPRTNPPLYSTGVIGHDNTIARHGIHGLYRLYNVDVAGDKLVQGENIVFFTQAISSGAFNGLMYDYIRLEGPPPS